MKSWMMAAGLALGASAMAAEAPPQARAPDPLLIAVAEATATADVPTLTRMYGETGDPVKHALAAMALERIHLELGKSSEIARLCERELRDSRPDVALFCARFANGNLRLAQGAAVADPAELDIVRRFEGRVPQAELDAMRRYVDAHLGPPPLRVEAPAAGVRIPLVHGLRDNRGAIEVQAHGQKARLVIDTGASYLAMDEGTARRLGVRMLDRSGETAGILSRGVPVRYGVLDRLDLGGVTVENAPVEVLPSRARLIGIDILRQLGAFRLSRDDLQVYGRDEARPACREPMLVSSGVWANSLRPVAALPIEGTRRTTLIDSGSTFYLSGSRQAMDQLHTIYNRRIGLRDVSGRRHEARFSQATARVVISGQPIDMTFGVLADAKLPWDYILGSGALRDMDFYLDFERRRTCLLLHPDLH